VGRSHLLVEIDSVSVPAPALFQAPRVLRLPQCYVARHLLLSHPCLLPEYYLSVASFRSLALALAWCSVNAGTSFRPLASPLPSHTALDLRCLSFLCLGSIYFLLPHLLFARTGHLGCRLRVLSVCLGTSFLCMFRFFAFWVFRRLPFLKSLHSYVYITHTLV
jgi:hypothetical protein